MKAAIVHTGLITYCYSDDEEIVKLHYERMVQMFMLMASATSGAMFEVQQDEEWEDEY